MLTALFHLKNHLSCHLQESGKEDVQTLKVWDERAGGQPPKSSEVVQNWVLSYSRGYKMVKEVLN